MKKTQIQKELVLMLDNAALAIKQAQRREVVAIANQQNIAALLALVPNEVQYVSVYSSSVDYTLAVKGFNTAKTKRLLEAYIELADTFGMRLETSSDDAPEYNTRTFRFKYFAADNCSSWEPTLSVSIRCELIEGGTACRRVQVGEKVEVVKTPEYKFVCK